MRELDTEKVNPVLCEIVEFELAGVVRFTHYSLMVSGPNRIPIVEYLKAQAAESLTHAQQAGEILTGLGGHPTMRITGIEETHQHGVLDILEESHAHESKAVDLYGRLLVLVEGKSVYLEEYARSLIANEEAQVLEFRKMMADYS